VRVLLPRDDNILEEMKLVDCHNTHILS